MNRPLTRAPSTPTTTERGNNAKSNFPLPSFTPVFVVAAGA